MSSEIQIGVREGFQKSVENSTVGWVGGSGVGQNPQKIKKTCLKIRFRPF